MSADIDVNQTIFNESDINSHQNISFDTNSSTNVCIFTEITSLRDFINLFSDKYCRRHSAGFTAFLCVANLLILVCGLIGNSIVIYVVTRKIKKKTASSLFILNLAVADLLVITCCIPATLVANIFVPWIFGDIVCKIVAYAQGVSVFCSVYSLVAISFDRCRAIHQTIGLTPNISNCQALTIILLIWILGVLITIPWAFVFKLVYLVPYETKGASNDFLPFCHEIWSTKSEENLYFLLAHVFACFLLPLGLIAVCNLIIWRSALGVCQPSSVSSSASLCLNVMAETHRKRKLRVLKMFTFLTFAFFVCWLPLYLIMARVKFFYNDQFSGFPWERKLIVVFIPLAQLLGSCNSCVNPILYALLNQKFRESFKSILVCRVFCHDTSPSVSIVGRRHRSVMAVVAS